MEMMLFAFMVYWTVGVTFIAIFTSDDWDIAVNEVVGIAVFWPIVAILWIAVALYRAKYPSVAMIRHDLRNKKLLKEFDEWRKEREDDAGE